MALTPTLHRFTIDLSDVDRGVYERLDLRVAQHPSETVDSLVTRVIAYCLELEDGLQMGPGVCVGDEPALHVPDPMGGTRLWIDVGSPSPERIHKASKASGRMCIYTYKDVDVFLRSLQGHRIHRAEHIELVSIPRSILSVPVERHNDWTVVHTEGALYVTVGSRTYEGALRRLTLA